MRSTLPLGGVGRLDRLASLAPGRRMLAGEIADRAHSRRVARLKFILPALGVALLLLVAAWPRLAPLWDKMRLASPAIDLRDARELRMLNPRYAGVDRENRPFVVTAAVGRQVPDRTDLMSLELPRAEMTLHNGTVVVVTAATGIYQSQAQMFDLFGDVVVTRGNDTRFTTDTARVDVAHSSAQGDDPVQGHGPTGDIKARGFRILDGGTTTVFTGQSDLVLKSVRQVVAQSDPPAVPAAVAEQASAIEAEAKPILAQAAKAEPPARPKAAPLSRGHHPPAHRGPTHQASGRKQHRPAARPAAGRRG